MPNCTPLRYPGGKARLLPYLQKLIAQNKLHDAHYVEPFCGGAGLALELLFGYSVSTIHINDLDRAVYAFWNSAVFHTDALCEKISDTPCDIDTWHLQRDIWTNKSHEDLLDLGFATFFLNRTNRSGILAAGVIGGKGQSGNWKIDARYNRDALTRRIEAIGRFRSRISVHNLEAVEFLERLQPSLPLNSLVYLDPPYVDKGPGLYLNSYQEQDHRRLANWVTENLKRPWIVSYDNHALIRECYDGHCAARINLTYSAYGNARYGEEVMYFSPGLTPPDMSGNKYKTRKPWETISNHQPVINTSII
ncbi:MAG: DNA adenine methylase [Gallionella sp.]|jgi:DNA adenine methylase|nr:DNA adenine methylase [Gallionella sp.]MCK9354580.1 DNA adenine methylase [Gallionella sp.]